MKKFETLFIYFIAIFKIAIKCLNTSSKAILLK